MRNTEDKVKNNVYDKLINLIESRVRINNSKIETLTVGLKRDSIAYTAITELFKNRNYALITLKQIIIVGAKKLGSADYIEVNWTFNDIHPTLKYHYVNDTKMIINTIKIKHISLPKIDSKLFIEVILEIFDKQEIKLAA
jgi:hypothetical protein